MLNLNKKFLAAVQESVENNSELVVKFKKFKSFIFTRAIKKSLNKFYSEVAYATVCEDIKKEMDVKTIVETAVSNVKTIAHNAHKSNVFVNGRRNSAGQVNRTESKVVYKEIDVDTLEIFGVAIEVLCQKVLFDKYSGKFFDEDTTKKFEEVYTLVNKGLANIKEAAYKVSVSKEAYNVAMKAVDKAVACYGKLVEVLLAE